MPRAKTLTSAVSDYIKSAEYLTDEDEPMVLVLKMIAAELDSQKADPNASLSAPLLREYGLILRNLRKQNTQEETPQEMSPAERGLRALGR